MCGKSTFYKPWSIRKIEQDFGSAIAHMPLGGLMSKLGDQRPGDMIPVIVSIDNNIKISVMKWGLTPSWAKMDRAQSMSFYNARAESLTEKASFKDLLNTKRCVLPTDAFFEGHGETECKFERPDGKTMWLAGLWTVNEFVYPREGCTVITCEPSSIVRPAHHRMPVVLSDEDSRRWLDPKNRFEDLKGLLVPYQGELVRTAVNSRQLHLNFRG